MQQIQEQQEMDPANLLLRAALAYVYLHLALVTIRVLY